MTTQKEEYYRDIFYRDNDVRAGYKKFGKEWEAFDIGFRFAKNKVYNWHITKQIKLLEEVKKEIGETYRSSPDGLCGYQILPDCDEEKHDVKECADCYFDSLITNLKGEL